MVVNLEPSIQAAFVDFGVGRNGFLHISNVESQYFRQGGFEPGQDFGQTEPAARRRDTPLPPPRPILPLPTTISMTKGSTKSPLRSGRFVPVCGRDSSRPFRTCCAAATKCWCK